MVYLEHGKPLLFGKNKNKTLRLNGLYPEITDFDPTDTRGLLIDNETDPRPNHAYLLTQLIYPDFPVPFGVFRAVEKPTYDDLMNQQIRDIVATKGKGTLEKLIYSGDTWRVQ